MSVPCSVDIALVLPCHAPAMEVLHELPRDFFQLSAEVCCVSIATLSCAVVLRGRTAVCSGSMLAGVKIA